MVLLGVLSCLTSSQDGIDIRLDAIPHGVFETPVARFSRIYLPEEYVQKINERIRAQKERNPIPFGK